MVPLMDVQHLYEALLGDTPVMVFLKELLPLVYVAVMPLLSMLLACLCRGAGQGVFAMRWPPQKERHPNFEAPPVPSRRGGGQTIILLDS